jgi:3-hydroxyisobutyrate dehydrogenase-like beta-hydroxyacid dehydrogenase
MKVGFIGLGRMGSAMARRLIDGKHDVGVYNRSPDKLKSLTDARRRPLTARRFSPCLPTMPRFWRW